MNEGWSVKSKGEDDDNNNWGNPNPLVTKVQDDDQDEGAWGVIPTTSKTIPTATPNNIINNNVNSEDVDEDNQSNPLVSADEDIEDNTSTNTNNPLPSPTFSSTSIPTSSKTATAAPEVVADNKQNINTAEADSEDDDTKANPLVSNDEDIDDFYNIPSSSSSASTLNKDEEEEDVQTNPLVTPTDNDSDADTPNPLITHDEDAETATATATATPTSKRDNNTVLNTLPPAKEEISFNNVCFFFIF